MKKKSPSLEPIYLEVYDHFEEAVDAGNESTRVEDVVLYLVTLAQEPKLGAHNQAEISKIS